MPEEIKDLGPDAASEELSPSAPPAPAPASPPPVEPDAPQPPPLRAVFMVWPGRTHAQTWVFLWIGVVFLVGSLLPWYGSGGLEYICSDGTVMTKASYDHKKVLSVERPGLYQAPAEVTWVREPGMGLGPFLVFLCALGMVVSGVTNVWLRRLTLWPSLLCWMVAFAVLYFTRGYWSDPKYVKIQSINGLAQLGDMLGAVFGEFGSTISGELSSEQLATLGRFGLGFYLTLLADLFLVLFIVGSVVVAVMSAKKEPAPAAAKPPGFKPGGMAGRRPGRR